MQRGTSSPLPGGGAGEPRGAPSVEEPSGGDGRATIEVRDVSLRYRGGRRGSDVVALSHVDLTVGPSEFVSLLGPSGCGKTTLLKVIGGLVEPSEGVVDIAGQSPSAARARHAFGFVFQDANLLKWRDALGNARLLAEIIDRRHVDDDRIRALMKTVGLGDFLQAYPSALSGGMRQRVGIVRALAFQPEILLMDEPFAALDALTRDSLGEVLLDVWGGQRPVVFVTHSIEEAAFLSDRVVVMTARPGRIYEEISVPLPRPRTVAMRDSVEFLDVRRRLRALIETAMGGQAAMKGEFPPKGS
ncbi:MAG: ABC transporter ATP-binding protein [Acidimicrobiales bacterium]